MAISFLTPAGSLHAHSGGGHDSLQVLESAILCLNHCAKISWGQIAAAGSDRSKVLPEYAVVKMTTSVKFNSLLKRNNGGNISLVCSLLQLYACKIEICNISGVMLSMMDLHNLCRYLGRIDGLFYLLEFMKIVNTGWWQNAPYDI